MHVVKVGFSKKKIITGPMVPGNSIKVKIAENGFERLLLTFVAQFRLTVNPNALLLLLALLLTLERLVMFRKVSF